MSRNGHLELDHLTVVARTLEEGAAHIRRSMGIDMPAGGAHPRMGTHNRLLALGEGSFLELIAIDPEATPPDWPRWFDLDRFDGEPVLATWVLRVDDILVELAQAHPRSGSATRITRGDLSWLISFPKDGSMPLNGAFPTLIEWPEGRHPAAGMVDLGCRLRSLAVTHPQADEIDALIGGRIDCDVISIRRGERTRLQAEIDTPAGARVLV